MVAYCLLWRIKCVDTPGNIFQAPYPFKDTGKGTLMGISIWESEAAFQAALPALQKARQDSPSHDLEVKPPEVYLLNSVIME